MSHFLREKIYYKKLENVVIYLYNNKKCFNMEVINMAELGYIDKCLIAAKASLNASCLTREGSEKKLMDAAIETMDIKALPEYMRAHPERFSDLDISKDDNNKLMQIFVIPVVLSNGEQIDVIVNQKGQDMACVFRDEADNKKSFQLTPRMKNQISENVPDISEDLLQSIGYSREDIEREFFPETLKDFAEKVEDDSLVPKSKKESIERINNKSSKNIEEVEKENGEEEQDIQVPEEIRDEIARLCSENDYDIGSLKEVMLVNPQTITDNLENTGFSENGGNVYCLRFKDSKLNNDRVVMVQPGKTPVDDRTYDDYMTDYMIEHRGQKVSESIEDEHDKIVYTDLHGHTIIGEIEKEPRDLNCSEKQIIQEEMDKLDESAEQIMNSDMPLEEKATILKQINEKRIEIFEKYGIQVPLVEDEIRADNEIHDEVIQDGLEEPEDDGRDPRESNHSHEHKLF